MLIINIRSSSSGNEVFLNTDKGIDFHITLHDFLDLGIDSLDNDEFIPIKCDELLEEKLNMFDEKLKAIKYASYLLSFGDKSEKKLVFKLKQKEYSQKAIELALETLKTSGIINDSELCSRKLLSLSQRKRYGYRRLKQEMYNAGFSPSVIEDCLDEADIDFDENAYILWKSIARDKDLQDIKIKKRLSDKMARYGYDYDQIRNCIEKYSIINGEEETE